MVEFQEQMAGGIGGSENGSIDNGGRDILVRFVGVFYWTWSNLSLLSCTRASVTKVRASFKIPPGSESYRHFVG